MHNRIHNSLISLYSVTRAGPGTAHRPCVLIISQARNRYGVGLHYVVSAHYDNSLGQGYLLYCFVITRKN